MTKVLLKIVVKNIKYFKQVMRSVLSRENQRIRRGKHSCNKQMVDRPAGQRENRAGKTENNEGETRTKQGLIC